MLEISLLRRLMIIFVFNLHVKQYQCPCPTQSFYTLQIELYRVVDYDRKWSTKFQNDCMLELFLISLLRRLMIFLILKIVLGPMSDTELLQYSKLNCTVQQTMIASGLLNFIGVVCLIFCCNFNLKTSYDNFFIFKIVFGPMSDTELLQHSKLNCTV